MGSPYLSADESIILSAHDLIINTIPAEAILTNKRLMLVDRDHPRLPPQDIPFTAVEAVTIGDSTTNDPILSLSIVTPDGTRKPLGMTFPRSIRADRIVDRDEWATRIRELSLTSQHEGGIVVCELLPPWIPGTLPEEPSVETDGEIVPAGTKFKGSTLSERRSRAAGASKTRMIGIAAAVVVIIAVIVAVVFFYAPPFTAAPVAPPVTTPTPATSATPSPVPTAATMVTPSPTETVTPAATPGQVSQGSPAVPQTGVWVRVKYDGKYTGTVGAPGRFKDIAGSGEQFYQIPARDEIVTATIQKQDNTGNQLTVEIYNEGILVGSDSLTRPRGIINLDVNLKTAAPGSSITVRVTAPSAAAAP